MSQEKLTHGSFRRTAIRSWPSRPRNNPNHRGFSLTRIRFDLTCSAGKLIRLRFRPRQFNCAPALPSEMPREFALQRYEFAGVAGQLQQAPKRKSSLVLHLIDRGQPRSARQCGAGTAWSDSPATSQPFSMLRLQTDRAWACGHCLRPQRIVNLAPLFRGAS